MKRFAGLALCALGVVLLACPQVALAKTYPETTVSGIPDTWTEADVTFTLVADSSDVAGVIRTWYTLDGVGEEYLSPVTVTRDGLITLTYWSTTTDCISHEQPLIRQIRIDRNPPTSVIHGLPTGWTLSGVYGFTIDATDAGSGVAQTYYRIDGGAVVRYTGGTVPVIASRTTSIECWSVDPLGHTEQPKTAVIHIDDTIPLTTIQGVSSDWVGSDVVFTLATRSPMAAVTGTYYRFGSGPESTYTAPVTVSVEGVTTVAFRSVNSLGKVEEIRTATIRIDRTPPVSSITGVPTGWSRGATIGLTGSDALSGLSSILYRIGGGAEVTYSQSMRVAADGETSLEWWAIDAAGNVEAPRTATVRVDNGAPVSTVSGIPGGVSLGPVVFSLSALDEHSGVAGIMYAVGAGPTVQYAGPVTVTTPGVTTLTYWAVDGIGNAEAARTAAITISGGAGPVTTIAGVPEVWVSRDVTFALSARAADLPVTATYYRAGAGPVQAYVGPVTISDEGATTVDYFSIDQGGAAEPTKTASVRIDRSPPTTTSDAVGTYVGSATVHLTRVDSLSGVAHTWCKVDSGAVSEATSVTVGTTGNHTLSYWSVDAAGNVEATRSATFNVTAIAPPRDTTPPSTTSDATSTYVGSATIHLSAADQLGGSGVARTYHHLDGGVRAEGDVVVSTAGAHSLEFWSVDVAGNAETRHTVGFTVTALGRTSTSLTIATSRARALIGQSFVLSGISAPSPSLVGRTMHVDVKKPDRSYWTYSSARVIYSNAGVASWWYRYGLVATMKRGTYLFKAVYDGDGLFMPSQSSVISVGVR